MPDNHALLAPSGASRWLACPPSARFEETFPDSSSSAADEGTLAHKLCEIMLKKHLNKISNIEYNSEMKKIKHNLFYNTEMVEHCSNYVTSIIEKISTVDAMVFIENKIDLQEYIPEGFGTIDCIIIYDDILEIIDFKYGKGVLVDAENNKQLMLYALGALKKYSLTHDIRIISMTIFQPRLNNYPGFHIEAEKLINWGLDVVIPAAKLAFAGKGDFNPGSHCRFCKARNNCKALAEFHMSTAKEAFADQTRLSDKDIAEILTRAPDFKIWLTQIQEYALHEAVTNQKEWPGFKLVAGRSNRIYTNKLSIIAALKKAKIKLSLFMTSPDLIGIGALEKNIGKSEVDKLVGKFIIKPEGAATLVPEWDKRPALNESSEKAFENVNN